MELEGLLICSSPKINDHDELNEGEFDHELYPSCDIICTSNYIIYTSVFYVKGNPHS